MLPVSIHILKWLPRIQSPRHWLTGGFRAAFGSCFMRADQLARLIRPYLPDDLILTTGQIGPRLPLFGGAAALSNGARVVILTKHAAERTDPEIIAALRRTGALVGVDHVDSDFDRIAGKPFDFHISATLAGLAAMQARFAPAPVFVLHHHADPRIRPARTDLDRLHAAYLGKPSNCHLPAGLMPHVTMLHAVTDPQMQQALPRLRDFNLHYAMRPAAAPEGHGCKPFLKGFNAAAAGANILVARDTDDALHFLGADYPYLMTGTDDATILRQFEAARDGHGGPDWRRGLDRMRALRDAVSGPTLARDFTAMIRTLTR